jgi:hypothetical protein
MNNMIQKISIKYNSNEELIISVIPELQKPTKIIPKVRNFEN